MAAIEERYDWPEWYAAIRRIIDPLKDEEMYGRLRKGTRPLTFDEGIRRAIQEKKSRERMSRLAEAVKQLYGTGKGLK